MDKKLLALFISFVFGGAAVVLAAQQPLVYFEKPNSPPGVGSVFSVRLLIDSAEKTNAYEVSLQYPTELLEFTNFNNSHSIIDVWQTQTAASDSGKIQISGGSLAPFSGKNGEILTMDFKALSSGLVKLKFTKGTVYLADGKGTQVTPQSEEMSFNVLESTSQPIAEISRNDSEPPQINFLSVVPDPFNSDQKILSFNVSDPGSGVKEVQARSMVWLSWGSWQTLGGSAALDKTVWAVDFKAVDNAGNIREKIVYDWRAFGRTFVAPAAVLGVLLIAALVAVLAKKRRCVV